MAKLIKLLRKKLGREWYEFTPANTLLVGWIGFMCDCAELLLQALKGKGNRDLAGLWLRPIIETSIVIQWIGHDEARAWRAMTTQYKSWEKRSKEAVGTIFAGPRPPKPLRPGKALPPVTQMARELGQMETLVFMLESERLHPGAATALEYAHIVDLDETQTAVQLRTPPREMVRASGVLAVALHCLLRAGVILDQRFNLGLASELHRRGDEVFVGLDADATREGWDALFEDGDESS